MPTYQNRECLLCGFYFTLTLNHLDIEYCSEECRVIGTTQLEDAALSESKLSQMQTINKATEVLQSNPEIIAALKTVEAGIQRESAGGFSLRLNQLDKAEEKE